MHELATRLDAFVSAPIKLALKISARRDHERGCSPVVESSNGRRRSIGNRDHQSSAPAATVTNNNNGAQLPAASRALLLFCLLLASGRQLQPGNATQLVNHGGKGGGGVGGRDNRMVAEDEMLAQLRNHAHYLSAVPAVHFAYHEGRQSGARALLSGIETLEERSAGAHVDKRSSAALLPAQSQQQQQPQASFRPPRSAHNPPLVSSSASATIVGQHLSRRMLPAASSWHPAEPGTETVDELLASTASEQHQQQQQQQQQQQHQHQQHRQARKPEVEAELLRQKQHIQYHDQWPSMAGKCHKRTLNFCASVLPFNTTTFPNIIGDTNRFEVKRSLPFFGFLAKSSCNKRLDELLCLLLEPPCSQTSGLAIPPCKKFCRLALEGCNEYIPATLALSSVFDCRQYPDSSEPDVCINLAQGSKCADDEFKCPDKTCIPRNWLCDGVRDCLFAADEANCTNANETPALSVCSTEEFKCDGKCVPKAWRCDGERDCLDGSDEEMCDARPRCGPDRFKCADGNGCIPKPWVCDGKAECRDGSDELNCEQRQCADNDFKCGNGVCIPKLWRCDRQLDCKDGSDEQFCVYPSASSSASPSSTTAESNSETAPVLVATTTVSSAISNSNTSSGAGEPKHTEQAAANQQQQQHTVNASYTLELQAGAPNSNNDQLVVMATEQPNIVPSSPQAQSNMQEHNSAQRQFEAQLVGDVARIIQHESASVGSSEAPPSAQIGTQAADGPGLAPKELRKLDYEYIQNVVPTNEPNAHVQRIMQPQRSMTPVDDNQRTTDDQQRSQAQKGEPQVRVPIYRSLFKSLKGNHQQQQQQVRGHALIRQHLDNQPIEHSAVRVIARRRRDRVQQQAARQISYMDNAAPATHTQQQSSTTNEQNGTPNQTRANVPAAAASYFSLLNSRYNLRLPRTNSMHAAINH